MSGVGAHTRIVEVWLSTLRSAPEGKTIRWCIRDGTIRDRIGGYRSVCRLGGGGRRQGVSLDPEHSTRPSNNAPQVDHNDEGEACVLAIAVGAFGHGQ